MIGVGMEMVLEILLPIISPTIITMYAKTGYVAAVEVCSPR